MKQLRRAILIAVALILAVGLLAPFLNTDHYRPAIQAALQASLNRHVEIGDVRLNLFTGPGFTLADVLIEDDPSAGIEPFAHVKSLQARLKLTSLLAGKLAFSTLRLVEPDVNLVKTAAGGWNIAPLLNQQPSARPGHKHSLPDIEISDGRLNFKFGDTKSVFYVYNADVEIYPDRSGDVVIRFSGEPARTDRGAQGFGKLSARGLLRSTVNGEDQLNLGLRLEKTSLSDLMMLFYGRDIGVHGFAVANARLSGPLSKLDITGDLNMDDVHRWDFMPSKAEAWNLNLRGLLNLRAQQLELETIAPAQQILPVSVKLRVNNYLSAPKWAAFITLRDLPAASFFDTARHMGAPLPAGMQVDGKVQGVVGYSREGGMQGTLSIDKASIKISPEASAEFDSIPLVIAGNDLAFGPAGVHLDNEETAQVQGHYAMDGHSIGLRVSSRELTVASVESGATRVLDAAPIPVLERLKQGTFSGWVAFERKDEEPGKWTGEYGVQNALMDIPGVAEPVLLASASVDMQGEQIRINRIRARAGNVKFEGSYRFDLTGTRPHALYLSIPELQLADLETLLMPALRRQEGFLARTFRLRRTAVPEWLKARELEGSVQVGNLQYEDAQLGTFRARLLWTGAQVHLSQVECRRDDMVANGSIGINLTNPLPRYHLAGRVESMEYRSGTLNLEGELDASGTGVMLPRNARADGSFDGSNLNLGPDADVREISGTFHLASDPGLPRLQLQNVELSQGSDVFIGQGASQADGRIVLELTSGRRQVRMTGMLLPVHPE